MALLSTDCCLPPSSPRRDICPHWVSRAGQPSVDNLTLNSSNTTSRPPVCKSRLETREKVSVYCVRCSGSRGASTQKRSGAGARLEPSSSHSPTRDGLSLFLLQHRSSLDPIHSLFLKNEGKRKKKDLE